MSTRYTLAFKSKKKTFKNLLIFPELTCEQVPAVQNGTVSNGTNQVGSLREIRCSPNYQIRGPTVIFCLNNGQWTMPGVCQLGNLLFFGIYFCPIDLHINIGSCGSPPIVLNGLFSEGASSVGSQRTLTCNTGFQLEGNEHIRCFEGGVWSDAGRCSPLVRCYNVPQIGNANISSGNDQVQSSRNISCHPGYEIIGPNKIYWPKQNLLPRIWRMDGTRILSKK